MMLLLEPHTLLNADAVKYGVGVFTNKTIQDFISICQSIKIFYMQLLLTPFYDRHAISDSLNMVYQIVVSEYSSFSMHQIGLSAQTKSNQFSACGNQIKSNHDINAGV
jgi:hypothetical protein